MMEDHTQAVVPARGWYAATTEAPDRERFWNGTGWTTRVRLTGTSEEAHVDIPDPRPPAPQPATAVAVRTPQATRRPSLAGQQASTDGHRYVSTAQIGDMSIRRLFDAACYLIAGIAFLVLPVVANEDTASSEGTNLGWIAFFGVGAILYGLKIALTRTSYWVSTLIYLVAVLSVGGVLSLMSA
jgi:hypothetical protein